MRDDVSVVLNAL